MPEAHTGINLQEALESTLSQWGLDPEKQICITTDSGSNIKLACQLLGCQRLSCFGHNLNLSVKKGLDDEQMRVDAVLRKCRRIVAAFSQSLKRSNELTRVQQQNDYPIHKLKGDVPTRWGSTAVMVKRILEQKEAIRVVLSGDRITSHLAISWQDINLTSIESFLSPLEDLTDTLSGESHVAISIVKPLLDHLCTDLLSPTSQDTELTKQMKQRCQAKILQQYESSEVKKLLDLATFVDPRFKHYKDNEEKKKEEAVKIEMLRVTDFDCNDGDNEADIQDNEETGPVPKKSKLGKFLGKRYGLGKAQSDSGVTGTSASRIPPLEKARNEISMYLQYPCTTEY